MEHVIFRIARHLLGLKWSAAPRLALEAAARALIALQRADGGWAQIPRPARPSLRSSRAGSSPRRNPALERGVRYLLNTQLADGSWFVRTRATPLQPHFESGFPHGRDQFISAAATNWATLALSHTVRRPRS